jgi:hypothetical protein
LKDLVLYCKSYRRDFLRLKRLLASIIEYNDDQIPFYISTPENQYQDLITALGTSSGFYWASDESIIAANPLVPAGIEKTRSGGLSQQVIKSEFWRLGISENYVCLDSDSKFIRNFKKSDFVTDHNVPYTVLHQNKELFQMASNRGHPKVERDLRAEAERVKLLFGRSGPNFYSAPSPFNWSAKVWQSLDQEYLQPRGITLWDLITPEHPESLLYAEALLKYRTIPLIAIEPLFRVYHYDWQYFLMKRLGESEFKLAQHYLGVIYQSAWDLDNQIGPSNKPLLSRIVRRLKQLGRYLQSYF